MTTDEILPWVLGIVFVLLNIVSGVWSGYLYLTLYNPPFWRLCVIGLHGGVVIMLLLAMLRLYRVSMGG